MAKSFSEAIIDIMPLVKQGSDLPFIISHEGDNWNINYFSLNPTATPEEIKAQAAEYLTFLREKDPYITAHTGKDFANGSFANVYDNVLCSRLRAEYNATQSEEVHRGEFQALINVVEDNFARFSQETVDYLLQFDSPLRELYDLNPISLYNRDGNDNEPYNAEKVDEFFEAVEYKIGELIKTQKPLEQDWNDEQSSKFQGTVKGDVELTAAECLPSSKDTNYTGKLLIVDPKELLPEFRSSTSQLVQCTHGNGARPNAKGTSVFGREIFSGASVVYGRHQILGVADNEKLPKWAQNKLERECASAIDKEVSAVRYDEMPGSARYNLKGAIDRLNFHFGAERVTAVLAAVVIINDNDGRFSHTNKQWAASVPNTPVDVVRRCEIKTHPAVLDGLVDKARESTSRSRETKPDLLGKINDNKQKVERDKAANTDVPTNKRKRDGQEV